MNQAIFPNLTTEWCPGCGNHPILSALKEALAAINKKPHEVLVVSGIGQAATTPQYSTTTGFCGLHGRALPPAVAAKIASKHLTVIVNSGDGDSYGEGGNHLIHNIRRNVDITQFVHNNQIYGLTKGQASPTSDIGYVTDVQPNGSNTSPLNPLLLAIVLGCGFVARGFSGDAEHLKALMVDAIRHKGYALIDILQPCVSFNKVNTYQWYKERVYKLGTDYDPENKMTAIEKAMEWGVKIPIGVLYREEKPDFHDKIDYLKNGMPLVDKGLDMEKISGFMKDFR